MYSISASRGPPAFVKRKNFSEELAHDSVANAHSLAKKKEFVITPFINHCTKLPIPEHDNENVNKVQPNDFWGRKGIIKMDTRDEDRCSHTAIPPSAMMTLAMELYVSNRGKASKLFRKGRLKSQSSDCSDNGSDTTEESNLINMWVVPEPDPLSGHNTPSTASHLKPSLVNADFVINRTSASNTPSSEIPSGETKLEKEEVAFLENLTAADLVGSPDHVIPYNDSDVEIKSISLDTFPENTASAKRSKYERISVAGDETTSQLMFSQDQYSGSKENKSTANEEKVNLETKATPQLLDAINNDNKKLSELKPGHTDCLPCHENIERNKKCFIQQYIKTGTTNDLTLTEDHEPNLTAPSDINHGDMNSLNHPQNNAHTSMSPEVEVLFSTQQIKAMQPVFDNADNSYKEIDNNNNETLLPTISHSGGYKSLTNHKKTSSVGINNNSRLNGFLQLDSDGEEQSSVRKNAIACGFIKDLSQCTEADIDILKAKSTSDTQSSLQTSKEFDFAEEVEVCRSETRGFQGCDLPLAAARSLSSSSLVSLSSLDSMSSASIQLSSYASGKASAASCLSVTSDLQDHNSKCQGSFSINRSAFTGRGERWHSNNDLTKFSNSLFVVPSTKDVANQYQRSINSNCLTKLNKYNVLQLRARSVNEIKTDSIRSSFGSVESQNKLRGGTSRCYSSLELRRPRSVSPSRKVICQYISQNPTADKKDNRKSPSGLIISQAVFPDETDSTVATPILHLKNTNRICTKCKNKMALCCCSSRRHNSYKSSRRESKDRICNVGDYSKIDKYVVVSSRSTQLGQDRNNSTRNGRAIAKITQASKPPISTVKVVEKNDRVCSDKTVTNEKCISGTKNFVKSSPIQVKAIVEPDIKTTAIRPMEKCRITLPSLKQSLNNGNTSDSCSNKSENKTMNNQLPQNMLFSSSIMAKFSVNERLLNTGLSMNSNESIVQEEAVISKSITGESAEFTKDNFQKEIKRTVEVINPNPSVKVINGSHIALKQISTDSNTSSTHFNSKGKNNYDKTAQREEPVLIDNAQLCMTVPLHKDPVIVTNQQTKLSTVSHNPDSVVIDNQFATDKIAYLSQGLPGQYQSRSLTKLKNSSLPSSTSVKLVNSGTSGQGSSRVVVRQKSIESDGVIDKRVHKVSKETKARHETCQNNSSLVSKSIVTEPHVKKMDRKTETGKKLEVFVNKASNGSDTISCKNTASQNSSKGFNNSSGNTVRTQKQDPSKKAVYLSHVSLSLQPARKSSIDNSLQSIAAVQHGQTKHVAGIDGDKTGKECRKWIHNLSSSVDSTEATNLIPRDVNNHECHDVERSRLRLPRTGHQPSSAPAHPLAASPTRQMNRIEMRCRVSPRGSYNKNDEDYEVRICHDGTRTSYPHSEIKREEVRDKKSASHVDCLRETPSHTVKDEEDFSGVVDEPMMKVKEIRAKYKGRDYENYAKPRNISSSGNTSRKGSEDGTRRSFTDYDFPMGEAKEPKNVVAQQVMNLFKGALDVEKELTVFEEESRRIEMSQNKQKLTPVKRNGPVITIIERTCQEEQERETLVTGNQKSDKLMKDTWPHVQPDEMEKKNIRRSVEDIKSESKEVASFDESLDQFYDVFNDLTS